MPRRVLPMSHVCTAFTNTACSRADRTARPTSRLPISLGRATSPMPNPISVLAFVGSNRPCASSMSRLLFQMPCSCATFSSSVIRARRSATRASTGAFAWRYSGVDPCASRSAMAPITAATNASPPRTAVANPVTRTIERLLYGPALASLRLSKQFESDGMVRVSLQQTFEHRNGVFRTVSAEVDLRQRHVAGLVPWRSLQQLLDQGHRRICLPARHEDQREVVGGLCIIGSSGERVAKVALRALHVAGAAEQQPQIVQRFGKIRLERQCLLIQRASFLVAAGQQKRIA